MWTRPFSCRYRRKTEKSAGQMLGDCALGDATHNDATHNAKVQQSYPPDKGGRRPIFARITGTSLIIRLTIVSSQAETTREEPRPRRIVLRRRIARLMNCEAADGLE